MNVLVRQARTVTNVFSNVLRNNGGYLATTRTAAFKSDLKIKWVRPAKIEPWKPEKSGDGGLDLNVKPQDYCHYFEKCKELEDADDIVKKMFTLEFNPRKETQIKKRMLTVDMVKRYKYDRGTIEMRIGCMTTEILDIQEYLQQHPRNGSTRRFVKELIDKRKKMLKILRRWDYKKFEWILEKLNLIYKPHPPQYRKITRKRSMIRLTQDHCLAIKQAKKDAYKQKLLEEQQKFWDEKIDKLKFIMKEELACGREPTVSEADIILAKEMGEKAKKMYARSQLTRKRKGGRVEHNQLKQNKQE